MYVYTDAHLNSLKLVEDKFGGLRVQIVNPLGDTFEVRVPPSEEGRKIVDFVSSLIPKEGPDEKTTT